MANNTKSDQPDVNTPMSIGKAIALLLLVYVLIGGVAIRQIRETCLLEREDCDYYGLVEWVLSDRLTLIASVILLHVLLYITWNFIRLARAGKLGIEEDPPEPKFNVSGLVAALVVFVLYLGGSLAVLMSGTSDLGQLGAENAEIFVWKFLGPMYGAPVIWMIFWHMNDYFVKPVSNVVLLLLFSATFGAIYLFVKMMIWSG